MTPQRGTPNSQLQTPKLQTFDFRVPTSQFPLFEFPLPGSAFPTSELSFQELPLSTCRSLDGLFLLRRDVAGLASQEDLRREIFTGKVSEKLGDVKDLPSHAIVDRGRLAGLWEYDVETESIVWMAFRKPDRELRQAVERTEEFIRADLGDARSFSLDSPRSRAPRIQALRE